MSELSTVLEKIKLYEKKSGHKKCGVFIYGDGSGHLLRSSAYGVNGRDNILYCFVRLKTLDEWLDKQLYTRHLCVLCDYEAFHEEGCACICSNGRYLCGMCSNDVVVLKRWSND